MNNRGGQSAVDAMQSNPGAFSQYLGGGYGGAFPGGGYGGGFPMGGYGGAFPMGGYGGMMGGYGSPWGFGGYGGMPSVANWYSQFQGGNPYVQQPQPAPQQPAPQQPAPAPQEPAQQYGHYSLPSWGGGTSPWGFSGGFGAAGLLR